jgi:hypothetical protein
MIITGPDGAPATITSGGAAAATGAAGVEFISETYTFIGEGTLRTGFSATLNTLNPFLNLAGGENFATAAIADTFTNNPANAFWNAAANANTLSTVPVFPMAGAPVKNGDYIGQGIGHGYIRYSMGANEQFVLPNSADFELEAVVVPEPCTLALLGTGILGVIGFRRRCRRVSDKD